MNEQINEPINDEQYFCRFTFGQFFAILVIEVVALFFAFYLGARYGEKLLGFNEGVSMVGDRSKVITTSDPEIQKIAKELIDKADTPALKDRISRMLEDAAKKQEDIEQREKLREMPAEEDEVIVEEPSADNSVSDAYNEKYGTSKKTEETEEKVALNEENEPETPPTPGVESASDEGVVKVKSSSFAQYSVQVGSYDNKKEAEQKLAAWRQKGYPAYLMVADLPDKGRWYRVRIGGFPSKTEADEYVKKEFNGVNALVIKNEQ